MLIRLGEGAESDRSDLERGNERVCPYKSGGVVVLDGLCVAEGLQDGVGLQQLLLQLALGHTQRSVTTTPPSPPARSRRLFLLLSEETARPSCKFTERSRYFRGRATASGGQANKRISMTPRERIDLRFREQKGSCDFSHLIGLNMIYALQGVITQKQTH